MAAERFAYLDALRGLALVLMVVNHTARFWLPGAMGWSRYHLIYVTMALAAPIFLFLVGFVLPLGSGPPRPARVYVRRALGLVGAGYALNVLVFPGEPWLATNVLHTIGFAILVATPFLYVLHRPGVRVAVLTLSAALYAAFSVLFVPLTGWVTRHPRLADVVFFDFPLWPWVSVVLLGLVLGRGLREQRDEAARHRYFAALAVAGVACVAIYALYEAVTPLAAPRVGFTRDFILNRHWTPRGITVAGILGAVFCLLAATYYLSAVRRYRFGALVVMGQTAFLLYFAHHFIVVTFGEQLLGVAMTRWWVYWLANALLMVALVRLGAAWRSIKASRHRQAGEPVVPTAA